MACYHRFKKKQKGSCLRCRFFDNKYVWGICMAWTVVLYFTGVSWLWWKIYFWRHPKNENNS